MDAQLRKQLIEETHFNGRSVDLLWRRFLKLDVEGRGYLTWETLTALPGMESNPVLDRVASLLDQSTRQLQVRAAPGRGAVRAALTRRAQGREETADEQHTMFDDHGIRISFSAMTRLLSVFSQGATREEVMRFLFSVFDCDGDGFIDRRELFHIFQGMCLSHTVTAEKLQSIVDKTIAEGDNDRDGRICYQEFCVQLMDCQVDEKLRVKFPGQGLPTVATVIDRV